LLKQFVIAEVHGHPRRCNAFSRLRRSSLRSRFGGVGGYGETSVVVQVPTGSGKTYINLHQ